MENTLELENRISTLEDQMRRHQHKGYDQTTPIGSLTSDFDWRFPDSPLSSTNIIVGKSVNSGTTYTVPASKRLYIYSMRYDDDAFTFRADGIAVGRQGSSALGQQGRTPGTLFLLNPMIFDAGVVLDTNHATRSCQFVGFLTASPRSDISLINQNVSSLVTYTVPSGKMFVWLNACTEDLVNLTITPSGATARDVGENINQARTGAGGWNLGQPWFLYPGDAINSESATTSEASINGYTINF